MTEAEIHARLKKCSKADLLVIIDRFRRHNFGIANWIIEMGFCDAEFEKEQRRLDEADRISEAIKETDDECRALLAPYEGKPLGEIPLPIIQHASTLAKKSRELNERWFRLMKIDTSGGEALRSD